MPKIPARSVCCRSNGNIYPHEHTPTHICRVLVSVIERCSTNADAFPKLFDARTRRLFKAHRRSECKSHEHTADDVQLCADARTESKSYSKYDLIQHTQRTLLCSSCHVRACGGTRQKVHAPLTQTPDRLTRTPFAVRPSRFCSHPSCAAHLSPISPRPPRRTSLHVGF